MLQRTIRVVQFGLGAIGVDIARLVAQHPALELVGGIDLDERKIGADLGDLLNLPQPLGVHVRGDAEMVLQRAKPDVVIIATSSLLRELISPVRSCAAVRAHVVSTCEELTYPFTDNPHAANIIDTAAREAGITVLGVGANPGFVMDLLPIFLTATSRDVQRVAVTRAVDASTYRWTLQQRLGVGIERTAFRDWTRQQPTLHIGLRQSLHMIAAALGWRLDGLTEGMEPILAEEWVKTPFVSAAPGQVAGIHQWAYGMLGRRPVIELEWRTAVGLQETYDAVRIDGDPPIDMVIRGEIHGDQATATLITRAIPAVLQANPGLRTMLDLPMAHYQALPRPQPEAIHT